MESPTIIISHPNSNAKRKLYHVIAANNFDAILLNLNYFISDKEGHSYSKDIERVKN